MIVAALVSFSLFFLLFLCAWAFGGYVQRAMEGKARVALYMKSLQGLLGRGTFRVSSVEMTYKEYMASLLAFEFISFLLLYTLLRLQPWLVSFLCHETAPLLSPHIALNLAMSFMTNTDWQCVSPEVSLHPLLKMIGLLPHMFLSPAVGLACFMAVLRGLSAEKLPVGNFFRDLIRALAFVLIPMTVLGALVLRLLGVEQGTFLIGRGEPVAFFEAIKQIGTNGGGYWSEGSMGIHENPTSWTTLVEWGLMLLLPMSALRIVSEKVGSKLFGLRVGFLFCVVLGVAVMVMEGSESRFSSLVTLDQSQHALAGKPIRVGSFFSSLWSVSTTATSCGATVSDLDKMEPLSKVVLLGLMHTGESIFGGVGVGAISTLFMLIVALFSAGLLVGRTPELFGKKIDSGTMKLSILAILLPVVLIYMGLWLQVGFASQELPNNPEQALTPLIYATTSVSVGNGSQIGGMSYTPVFMSSLHALLMLFGRLLFLIFALVLGEHVSEQKVHPRSEGTICPESWTSIIWLGFVILSSSLLCFCVLWVLGPYVEGVVSG